MKPAGVAAAYSGRMPSAPTSPPRGAHRLFFALWPPDALRDGMRAAADGVEAFQGAGRRTDPARYHLTLHFLGGWPERPDAAIERCRAAAQAVDCSAFHLVVDHAGGFTGARVGWLAPSGNSGLDALWSALGHALDAAGLTRRGPDGFSPHVTVLRGLAGRVRESAVAPLSWPVEDFVLVHSHDGRYDVVGRWPLRAAG